MAKPLKFHQTLNQAPRSAKHGQHRRPHPPSHGNSFVGTDHGAGGSDQDRTVTVSWRTLNQTTVAWTTFDPEPEPAIPYAGIRTGELIGHRLWWVIDGALCSLAHRQLWQPGETLHGDTTEPVRRSPFGFATVWGGVYAFSTASSLAPEIDRFMQNWHQYRKMVGEWGGYQAAAMLSIKWNAYSEASALVAGTIKMWGEVVEHDHGYRAEFAKLNSLDAIYGDGDLDALRARYGVVSLSSGTCGERDG